MGINFFLVLILIDVSGKSVCKYLGGQNGVTVSVVSNCGSGVIDSGTSIGSTESTNVNDVEDSDGEVSKIDFRGVNLRTKKKHDNETCDDNLQQQPERPMSWEGELSDQEMSSNTITNQVHTNNEMQTQKREFLITTFPLRTSKKHQWKEFKFVVQVLDHRSKSSQ